MLEDIRQVVERKLQQMLSAILWGWTTTANISKLSPITTGKRIAPRLKRRSLRQSNLVESLDTKQKRAAEEGLTEEELALFDLLQNGDLSKADREQIKQASKELLASLRRILVEMERWTEKEQTRSEVEAFVIDRLFMTLPTPPLTDEEKTRLAHRVSHSRVAEIDAGRLGTRGGITQSG